MNSERAKYNIEAGRRLQTVRRNIGITQAEMAEELGICEESVRRNESGSTSLTAERINNLYKSYNISPDYIVTGRKNEEDDIFRKLDSYLIECSEEEKTERACQIINHIIMLISGK